MQIDSLIYILEAIFFILVFFIFYKVQMKKKELELNALKKVLEASNEKDTEIKAESNSKENTHKTSFIRSEELKREELEKEILRLKQTIENTTSIAQQASMVKSEFLSNIRHEIRTPLNSILVFSSMLEEEISDTRLNSFAKSIDSSGRKLLDLLDNIIELSSIESGEFEIEESAVDVKEFFNSIIELHKQKLLLKNLKLFVEIDEQLPLSLMLDQLRVKEIVENLLSNAIKFTQEGFIKFTLSVISTNSASNSVDIAIKVEDSGAGISEENQSKIFEIFEKKDNCNAIEFEGTGLGLSINRKLAHLMGGTLEVKSEESKGSTFILTLKNIEIVLSQANCELENVEVDFNLIRPNGATILCIDNEQKNRDLVIESFKNSAVKVLDFDNSKDSIAFLMKNKVDMILIDVEMLSIDDGALSQVIQKISKAPVVTLTSSRIKGIDFGLEGVRPVGHLEKPIYPAALFYMALKVLNLEKSTLDTKVNETDSNNLGDKQSIKSFLIENEHILKTLYAQALKTNDLNTITSFAQTILKLANKYKLKEIHDFAELLLEKVELFEIDAINDMLKLYQSKIKRYKSFIKE